MPITDWEELDVYGNYKYKPTIRTALLSHSSFVGSGGYPGTKKIAFSFWDNGVIVPNSSNSLFDFFVDLVVTQTQTLYLSIGPLVLQNPVVCQISDIQQIGTSSDGFFVLTYFDETGELNFDVSTVTFYTILEQASSGTSGTSGIETINNAFIVSATTPKGQSSYYEWTPTLHPDVSLVEITIVGGGGGGGGGCLNSDTTFSIAGGGGGGGASVISANLSDRDLSYPIQIWVGAGGNGGLGSIINGNDGFSGGDGHNTIVYLPGNTFLVAFGGEGGRGGTMWNNLPGRSRRLDGVPLVKGGRVISNDMIGRDTITGGPGGFGRASKTDPAYDLFGYLIPPIDSHNLPYGFNVANQPIRSTSQFNTPSSIAPTGGGGGGGYVSTNLSILGLLDSDVVIRGGRILYKNKYTNEKNSHGSWFPDYLNSVPFSNTVFGLGGDGGSVQSSNLPGVGNNYGGGGGGGGAARAISGQDGADGANGICVIVEKFESN